MNISFLTHSDLVWTVEVACINMLTEELKRPELVDRPQLYQLVSKSIEDGTALIAKDGETPVGVLGGIVVPNMFNPNIHTLAELMWYILPNYRRTRAGLLLLNEYQNLAERVADEATFSLLPNSDIKNSTLEKRGFMFSEKAFVKRNNHGSSI